MLLLALACGIDSEVSSVLDGRLAECHEQAPAAFETEAVGECAAEVGFTAPYALWRWSENPGLPASHSIVSPVVVVPVEDSDGDGAVTHRDRVSIIAVTLNVPALTDADLIRLDGPTGALLQTLHQAGGTPPLETSGAAAGRLCAGDEVAVVYVGVDGRVYAVNARDFGLIWRSDARPDSSAGYVVGAAVPHLADLDGDGCSEILVTDLVLDSGGRLLGRTSVANFGESDYFGADAFDVDGDGRGEILRANAWYDADVHPVMVSEWSDGTTIGAGTSEGAAFVVARTSGSELDGRPSTHLRDGGGVVVWSGELSDNEGNMGFPAIGDVDGDGSADIVVAGYSALVALRAADGSELWRAWAEDVSSHIAAPALFDFTGDGAADVAYADEADFRIVNGRTGGVIFYDPDHCSVTLKEHPVVADVDGDGSVEILVSETDCPENPGDGGIVAYTNVARDWFAASPLWAMSGWREGNGAADLDPVPVATVSAGGSNLRERRRTAPPDVVPVVEGWCGDEYQASVRVSVVNQGGTVARDVGLELRDGHTVVASWALGVELEPQAGYGPVTIPVPSDAGSNLQLAATPSDLVCSDNDVIPMPAAGTTAD